MCAPGPSRVASEPDSGVTGGHFAVAWSVARPGFDPHSGPEHLSTPFMAPIFDRLVALRSDGSLAPMLAETWDFADGGERLDLQLRPEARFHDGTPVDSAAVLANLERGRSTVASPVIREQLRAITSIEMAGPHRLRLSIGEMGAGLPAQLATAAGMIVNPSALGRPGAPAQGAGSGPFIVDNCTAGTDDVLDGPVDYIAAPNGYWADEVRRAPSFTLREIRDHEQRLRALADGEVDIIDVRGVAILEARRRAEVGTICLVSYGSSTTAMIQFDRRSSVLADLRIRRAISMALDRVHLSSLFGGLADPIVQSLPADAAGHLPVLETTGGPDLAEARRLISRAGASGAQLQALQFADVEPMTTLLATFADQLREIGLSIELTALPPTELVGSWQAGGFDLRTTFASSLPGAAFVLQRRLNQTQSPGNLSAFSPRLTDLAHRLLDQRMSQDAADQLHATINRLMVEDVVGLEVCRLRNDVAARPGVVGIDDLPFATLNLFDVTNVTAAFN